MSVVGRKLRRSQNAEPEKGALRRLAKWSQRIPFQRWLWAQLGLRLTGAGMGYLVIWLGLLGTGLYQQYNLILLTAGLAAGPLVASFVMSSLMLRRLSLSRRLPQVMLAGEPLSMEYTLRNARRTTAALAVEVQDALEPQDSSIPGASRVRIVVGFERVGPNDTCSLRWQAGSLVRGRYNCGGTDLVTRSPFGLVERREILNLPGSLLVYPAIGNLTPRWQRIQRGSKETRRGRRHDRTAQQQEYHGLREYRSGDSPRWIHWRTTARTGELMVKEYEQEHEQLLAILIDPWLPASRATNEQRVTLESVVRFAATACHDACHRGGRGLLLGWTGTPPGVCQGPSSVRLLHEMLGQLALVKGTSEGKLVDLLEALPPAVIREALLVIVSTRPIALTEEFSSSTLLGEAWLRGLSSRLFVLDATRGDLDAYIDPPTGSLAADPAANRRNTRNKLSLYVLPEDGSTR